MAQLKYEGKRVVSRAANAKATIKTYMHRAKVAPGKSRLTLNSVNPGIKRTDEGVGTDR